MAPGAAMIQAPRPVLLGVTVERAVDASNLCKAISRQIQVKNTFIHMDEDGLSDSDSEKEGSTIAFHASKSAPSAVSCKVTSEFHSDLSFQGSQSKVVPELHSDTSFRRSRAKASTPRTRASLKQLLSTLGEKERAGLPSVGALLHGTGECKPCAFFWKADGCNNGAECLHCHACSKGEMRRRKKSKVVELRKERLAARSGQEALVPSEDDCDLALD